MKIIRSEEVQPETIPLDRKIYLAFAFDKARSNFQGLSGNFVHGYFDRLSTGFVNFTDFSVILQILPRFPCNPCPKKIYPELRLLYIHPGDARQQFVNQCNG